MGTLAISEDLHEMLENAEKCKIYIKKGLVKSCPIDVSIDLILLLTVEVLQVGDDSHQ